MLVALGTRQERRIRELTRVNITHTHTKVGDKTKCLSHLISSALGKSVWTKDAFHANKTPKHL